MRVIVIGSKIIIHKLSLCLSSANIEARYYSDQSKLIDLVRQEKFDIAVVDSAEQKAKVTCKLIRKFQGIPIALIVCREQVDWYKCQLLDPDGYIFDADKKSILIAHLRAIVRRYSQINSSTQK